MMVKDVEVSLEVVGQDQEPELIGRADIQDPFEAQGFPPPVLFQRKV